jgi:selenocysteine lyase/cysteine desulfurase
MPSLPDGKSVASRREFVRGLGRAAGVGALASTFGALALRRVEAATRRVAAQPAAAVAGDEEFWHAIQDAWDADRSLLNLNNGGCSPAPRAALEALFRTWRFANQTMYHNLIKVLEPQKEMVRTQLASLFGANPEEVAIVRNASEALETVTFGIALAPGDEVLSTTQDYPRMVHAWRQRAEREGIVFKQLPLPMPLRDPAEIVALFEQAITPRTRVMHFCHVLFTTGQILPVRALCRLARSRGILSIVDGAHAFAHVDARRDDLDCDFYGTSLHKWFSAPVGNGMLWMRKELIPTIWPLFAHEEPRSGDIRKFEQFGTHPVPIFLSIAEAARLHEAIGAERKQERMRHLHETWAAALRAQPRVRFFTSEGPDHTCGFSTFAVEGIEPKPLADHLFEKRSIVVAPILTKHVRGIRVTPHVYTTKQELERFVTAMDDVIRDGLPG